MPDDEVKKLLLEKGWSRETYEEIKRLGKNPRLYEPIKAIPLEEYVPKTPEEAEEHEEFVRRTKEYLKQVFKD